MFGMKKQLYLFSNFMPLLENVILSPLPRRLGSISMLKIDGRVSTSVQLQKYLYLSSKNGTIETKNTTISMSVRKGKTMYNE